MLQDALTQKKSRRNKKMLLAKTLGNLVGFWRTQNCWRHLREEPGLSLPSYIFWGPQVMWGRYFQIMRVDRPYSEDHPNEYAANNHGDRFRPQFSSPKHSGWSFFINGGRFFTPLFRTTGILKWRPILQVSTSNGPSSLLHGPHLLSLLGKSPCATTLPWDLAPKNLGNPSLHPRNPSLQKEAGSSSRDIIFQGIIIGSW